MERDGETRDSTCKNYMDFKMRQSVAVKKPQVHILQVSHKTVVLSNLIFTILVKLYYVYNI